MTSNLVLFQFLWYNAAQDDNDDDVYDTSFSNDNNALDDDNNNDYFMASTHLVDQEQERERDRRLSVQRRQIEDHARQIQEYEIQRARAVEATIVQVVTEEEAEDRRNTSVAIGSLCRHCYKSKRRVVMTATLVVVVGIALGVALGRKDDTDDPRCPIGFSLAEILMVPHRMTGWVAP